MKLDDARDMVLYVCPKCNRRTRLLGPAGWVGCPHTVNGKETMVSMERRYSALQKRRWKIR